MQKNIFKHHRKKEFSRFDWRTILLKNSGGLSSKRLCGIIGWFFCIGLLVFGYVQEKEIPAFAELVAVTSAGLLGLDSITSIWNKSIQN